MSIDDASRVVSQAAHTSLTPASPELLDVVGDLVPNKLVEGSVLRLGFESGDVGRHFGSIHQALSGGGTDLSEAGTLCDLGLGEGGSATAAYVGKIGSAGIGGGSRAVHIGGTGLLGDFAREVVNRVEIKDFSHNS